jgi:hypothetical protein
VLSPSIHSTTPLPTVISAGVISKDPINYTPQVLGSMMTHGAAPNAAVSYADRDHVPSKHPIYYSPADRRGHVSTSAIYNNSIDYTPQSPESSKLHGAAPNTESLTSSIAALSHTGRHSPGSMKLLLTLNHLHCRLKQFPIPTVTPCLLVLSPSIQSTTPLSAVTTPLQVSSPRSNQLHASGSWFDDESRRCP